MSIIDELLQMYGDQYSYRGMGRDKTSRARAGTEEASSQLGSMLGGLIGQIWGPIGKMAGEGGGRHLGWNIGRMIEGKDIWPTLIDQFITGPIIGEASPFAWLTKQLFKV